MSNSDRTKSGLSYIKRYALLLGVAWSVIVFGLLLWNTLQTRQETRKYAHIYTNSAFEKEILYRRWATMHGGVYVPVTNKTPSNPYLSEIPERDLTTTPGRQLTLMNPAYMTRQVHELEREVSDARSHLTSLKAINPENVPDEWEKKALVAFERGVTEISSIENIKGREYFRLMRPLTTEEGCLKCHAGQGYKLNDIRGGISVSLPLDSIRKLAGTSQSRNISIYLLLWLVGMGGIVFGYYRVSKSEFKRNQAEKELKTAYLELEKKVRDRTADLNQVNETLRKEQQFLAAVFDSIEEGIVSCDTNGVLTRFNRATRRIHGLPEKPIPADQWAQHYDLFLPDGKTPMKKEDVPLFRALQGEQVRNAEMMIIPKQGHARTFIASGQTLKDPEGKIIGAVAVMHDITERKRVEEAQRENEEKFATIFKAAPGSMVLTSFPDGKTIEVNDNFSLITGYSREEALGITTGDLKMWAKPGARGRFLSLLQQNGIVQDFEADLNHKSGAIRNGLVSGHIITVQGKKYLIGTFYDITDRKKAEEALRESEERFRKVFEEGPLGMAMANLTDGRFFTVNKMFCKMLGYTEEELKRLTFGDVTHPDFRAQDIETVRQIREGQIQKHKIEKRYLKKNGGVIWATRALTKISSADGKPFYALAMIEDITERKKAEEELKKFRDHLEDLVKGRTVELEEAQKALVNIVEDVNEKSLELAQANIRITELDRLKSAFLATMSHELRTPLNSIIGFTGIVLQGMSGPLNAEQAKQLTMVQGSANHLLALINDVLDISKIEAGQVEILRRSFDVRQVIEQALRTVLPLATKKGLSLDSVIASDVGLIISDHRRVAQILINLVGNAVKFTERGNVRIECRIKEGRLETCVRDTGIGIKPEDMDKIFRPFSQVETSLARSHEGTGLGLSICEKLVKMLGGTIRGESEWGKGSAFTFTLPLS